jgi:DNA repair exonuclease SbcCD ATPase subunit
VVEYRNLRDELSSKLDQMQKEGSDVEDQRRRYEEIKDKAPLLAPEIRKPGPRKFIEDLEGYIRDLKKIKSELEGQERVIKIKNWINEEIRKIKEFLGELEM